MPDFTCLIHLNLSPSNISVNTHTKGIRQILSLNSTKITFFEALLPLHHTTFHAPIQRGNSVAPTSDVHKIFMGTNYKLKTLGGL
jgi:hypothetical protein